MTHKTLTVSDILKIKSFSPRSQLQFSPDGGFLAYVVQDPDHKSSFQEQTTEFSNHLPTGARFENHSSAVWVTNIKTKESYKLGSDTRDLENFSLDYVDLRRKRLLFGTVAKAIYTSGGDLNTEPITGSVS